MWWMFLHGLFVTGGVGFMAAHPLPPEPDKYWLWDINVVRNPYGIVEMGYEYPVTKQISFSFEARHISSIPVNDFGTNTLEIHLKWRPFNE